MAKNLGPPRKLTREKEIFDATDALYHSYMFRLIREKSKINRITVVLFQYNNQHSNYNTATSTKILDATKTCTTK